MSFFGIFAAVKLLEAIRTSNAKKILWWAVFDAFSIAIQLGTSVNATALINDRSFSTYILTYIAVFVFMILFLVDFSLFMIILGFWNTLEENGTGNAEPEENDREGMVNETELNEIETRRITDFPPTYAESIKIKFTMECELPSYEDVVRVRNEPNFTDPDSGPENEFPSIEQSLINASIV